MAWVVKRPKLNFKKVFFGTPYSACQNIKKFWREVEKKVKRTKCWFEFSVDKSSKERGEMMIQKKWVSRASKVVTRDTTRVPVPRHEFLRKCVFV